MNERASPFPLEGGKVGIGGDVRHGLPLNTGGDRPAEGGVKRARRLRKESTVAERLLWAELRKVKANFRRQAPIGPYVADFAHHASRLIFEIDGYYHTLPERAEDDAARTGWLNAIGYRVIRFDEAVVRADAVAVAERMLAETLSPPTPTLPPSRGKGERLNGSVS